MIFPEMMFYVESEGFLREIDLKAIKKDITAYPYTLNSFTIDMILKRYGLSFSDLSEEEKTYIFSGL